MTRAERASQAGFSLIEALVAMALMGTVLAGLATVTAQWLPNWSRGFASVQRTELLQRGVERLTADFAAAEYVPLGGGDTHPLFVGSELSVTFVRRALGPNTKPGLEIVRIAETAGRQGPLLVRTRARFAPTGPDAGINHLPPMRDPVLLLRAPYRVTFSYAGEDRKWKGSWHDMARLPRTIRLTVRDTASQQIQPASTAVTIHVDAAPKRAEADNADNNETGKDKDNEPFAKGSKVGQQ